MFEKKMMIALVLVLSVLIVACGAFQFAKSDEDLGQLIADGAVLIDVRTNFEYDDTHIDGAINIPLGKLRENYIQLDPTRTYITYCSHGLRSIKAVKILRERGFKYAFNGGAMANIEALHHLP
ncbi:MAG: rhodanese-like domain-containing protein [Betaproteobacteria bacterium]|nr:MAG: rhodanese-like domain-containing protein [Betaproteobacteria bacterium]